MNFDNDDLLDFLIATDQIDEFLGKKESNEDTSEEEDDSEDENDEEEDEEE